MIPSSVLTEVEAIHQKKVESCSPVSGGSINEAFHLMFEDETVAFLKLNRQTPPRFFEVEINGLNRLRSQLQEVVVPQVWFHGHTADEFSFLVMDWLPATSLSSTSMAQLGRSLAKMHLQEATFFGLEEDNFIGALPQKNTPSNDWKTFYHQERIQPLLEQGVNRGLFTSKVIKQWEKIYVTLDSLLPKSTPSLLHGDLWSGNVIGLRDHTPALIDPAVYYGDREIEIAFTKLFGGFSEEFYRSYEEVAPLAPNFEERIQLYHLYPLLVHALLFEGSYIHSVESTLSAYV